MVSCISCSRQIQNDQHYCFTLINGLRNIVWVPDSSPNKLFLVSFFIITITDHKSDCLLYYFQITYYSQLFLSKLIHWAHITRMFCFLSYAQSWIEVKMLHSQLMIITLFSCAVSDRWIINVLNSLSDTKCTFCTNTGVRCSFWHHTSVRYLRLVM